MARSKKLVNESTDGIAPQAVESIVKPLVRVEGEEHILESLINKNKAPIMKAVGYMPIQDAAKQMNWISYTITIQGNKVLAIEPDEPNLRAIAEESAKIAFVESFIDHGAF